MTTHYLLRNIRALLAEAFTDEELRRLCYDTPAFKPVYDQLGPNISQGEVIEQFLKYAEHGAQLEILLDLAERHHPADYGKYQPYRVHPGRLFLCYKQHVEPDRKLATYLQQFFSEFGHTVFIDNTLRAGTAWLEEIDRQIKASDFLIVLLSKESANSEMVQAEVRRAYSYRKSQGHPHTLPIRLAYEDLLPYTIDAFLDPLQYVVWQSEADNERVGYDILAAIEDHWPEQAPVRAAQADDEVTVSEDGQLIADDDALHSPLPEFDPRFLEAPGGAVKLRDKLYIKREADGALKREIVKWGTTTTIRAARQTGKSSLLVRGIHHAAQNGAQVIWRRLTNSCAIWPRPWSSNSGSM
jgi:hypothetical protein